MKSCCNDCTRSSYCIRQYDEKERASCPILNTDNEPLRYRNSEGYSDPTAFFALRSAMRKPKAAKKRHPRTQVVHTIGKEKHYEREKHSAGHGGICPCRSS